MIVRREKIRKELHRSSMEAFYKQNDMLLDEKEDWSGEKLDFLRHRSTRFTEFSENYVTEKVWKEQNGRTTTFFDTTLEEEELMSTSQFEIMNEKDLHREAGNLNSTSRASSPKINGIIKSSSSSNTQRNIFDFFRRESKPIEDIIKTESDGDGDKCESRTESDTVTVKKLEFEEDTSARIDLLTDDEDTNESIKKEDCKMENLKEEKEEVTFKPITKSLQSTNLFENIEHIVGEENSDSSIRENSVEQCSSKKPLSNHLEDEEYENESINNDNVFKPSSLVRKGKKRFRNLAPLDERRNSPRLHKVTDEVLDKASNHKLKPLVNGSKKRRRLNSCGDFIRENRDEQPDYVRMTRSRVSSYT